MPDSRTAKVQNFALAYNSRAERLSWESSRQAPTVDRLCHGVFTARWHSLTKDVLDPHRKPEQRKHVTGKKLAER